MRDQETKRTAANGGMWNAWLPQSIKAEEEDTKVREQHEAWMAAYIIVGFTRSIAAGDVSRSGRYWVRAIQTHVFDLHRSVGSDETCSHLLRLLYHVVTLPNDTSSSVQLDPTLHTKWANVLARLLKKYLHLCVIVLSVYIHESYLDPP